jgi:hypothetical protein
LQTLCPKTQQTPKPSSHTPRPHNTTLPKFTKPPKPQRAKTLTHITYSPTNYIHIPPILWIIYIMQQPTHFPFVMKRVEPPNAWVAKINILIFYINLDSIDLN